MAILTRQARSFGIIIIKLSTMPDFSNQCFVCGIAIDPIHSKRNKQLNLPVCDDCCGSDLEKSSVEDHLEGMADGFVCGCI